MKQQSDNEYIHSVCTQAIKNGNLKMTQKELDDAFDSETIKKSKEYQEEVKKHLRED